MTLKKEAADEKPGIDPIEAMRLDRFTDWIKNLAVCLEHFTGE